MKNIIISTIVLMLLATTVSAQKIQSYVLKQQPKVVLNEGGPVAVHALTNNGTTMDDFGTSFSKKLTDYLNSKRLTTGGTKGKIHNSWYTTKLYELTDDDAAAKYIVAGDYIFTGIASKSSDLKKIKKEDDENAITIFYYSNTASASATVKGNITITSVSDGKVIKTFPISNTKNKSETKYVSYPDVPTVAEYSSIVAKEAIKKHQLMFSPVYTPKKYVFETLKGDKSDKAYKKEMKNKKKVFKALVSSGNVNELGKAYEALIPNVAKLKKPQDLYFNIGLCYELIGNYTKAKENYLKSAHRKAISEIETLIKYQSMFTKIGLPTDEKEF